METFLEILKYTLPGLIVFGATYFSMRHLLKYFIQRRELELRRESQKNFTPQKIAAYERLLLLLERIQPAELVLRAHKKGMKARAFQIEMLNAIRTEYQHNITQQLFVSNTAWNLIKNAKEETIKLINISATGLKEDATGIDLSNAMFQLMAKMEHSPVEIAKDYLKQELRKFM
jgi:hypothetical protein